jgi:hypothetical protein
MIILTDYNSIVPVIIVVIISTVKVKRIKWNECIVDLIVCSRRPRLEPTNCTEQNYI